VAWPVAQAGHSSLAHSIFQGRRTKVKWDSEPRAPRGREHNAPVLGQSAMAWRMPPVFKAIPRQLLGFHGFATTARVSSRLRPALRSALLPSPRTLPSGGRCCGHYQNPQQPIFSHLRKHSGWTHHQACCDGETTVQRWCWWGVFPNSTFWTLGHSFTMFRKCEKDSHSVPSFLWKTRSHSLHSFGPTALSDSSSGWSSCPHDRCCRSCYVEYTIHHRQVKTLQNGQSKPFANAGTSPPAQRPPFPAPSRRKFVVFLRPLSYPACLKTRRHYTPVKSSVQN
jgi:hypothetical protein